MRRWIPIWFLAAAGLAWHAAVVPAVESTYRGWKTHCLSNEFVEVQALPAIGGRVIQFKLGRKEFLWVNPQLAGRLPSSNGLAADGGWFNVGGDKLWPAPQGWDNDRQWPGPPDAVLDGQPYRAEPLDGGAALRLTSRDDPRSGIRFSRTIRPVPGRSGVHFEATMTNVDTQPRRWGLWAHTQLDGAKADGTGPNARLQAWCPLNPQSHFPPGYAVIFGATNHPAYQPDRARGLLRVPYHYQVGKLGLDSRAGWVATVDGESGVVFVQRFVFEPDKEYPDGSSVEFWLNGPGRIRAFNKDLVLLANPAENPYVFESEVLSPFARLAPGESYTWRYEWFATNIGGDFPVIGCNDAGVIAAPLQTSRVADGWRLTGRFGVFAKSTPRIEWRDADGRVLGQSLLRRNATPLEPLALDETLAAPAGARAARLIAGGELASIELPAAAAPGRWTAERANAWYAEQPWLVGFNYIPATAINTTEMWQEDTFDPKTMDAELALAEQAGFNCARVFLQYLVWENDPKELAKRMDQFLSIAKKHGLRTLFVLFDDCAFSTMTEPFLGKQPGVIPGEYANGWTPSPGPKRVQDRDAWPKLEAYVRESVGRFRDDPRVLGWDLYNEPGNTGLGNKSLPLLQAVFGWARQAEPSQPLTAGVWGGTPETTRVCLEQSDVISFHNYSKAPELEHTITELQANDRPLLCTEWLNRPLGSVAETCLPVLARHRVGAIHWGLVNGKTQTQFPWGSKAGAPEPKVWQHDIFRKDHTPYDEKELALFKDFIRNGAVNAVTVSGQWPATKAWAWYNQQPWLAGCNFLPSTAVNDVEMWQKESFDAATIERGLGWAQELGFNTVRVFVNYVVWEADAAGLKETLRQFLQLADRHGIKVMPILFDDCFKPEPRVGKQDEPEPGVHNSQWVQSPGVRRRGDQACWPKLEQYVKDVVGAFAQDRRIVIWDLYNEPSQSWPLVEAAFQWARAVKPSQPLTTCVFGSPDMQQRIPELCDIVSFHNYGPLPGVQNDVANLQKKYGRPVICTEWMARPGSTFQGILPYFKEQKIGCWNWGFVAGRTQTYYPWGSQPGAPEPTPWHHDILRQDGTPRYPAEVRFIKIMTGTLPPVQVIEPTAQKHPVAWRYSLERPAEDWFKPGFDDTGWKQGAAPFGKEEAPISRKPNTVWTSADIWLRRVFEMPAGPWAELALLMHFDEDAEVYINGVLAAKVPGYNAAYEEFAVASAAGQTLQPGRNLMAVHCRQTASGQYIDVGIVGVREKE